MKKAAVIANLILLLWFLLDMTGFSIGGHLLVSRAWREDGIFFVLYLAVFALFLFKEKVGKIALISWLVIWFTTQFYSHWYFTIAGPWEGKNSYFEGTIKLFHSQTVYIADLYHIVLHLLILLALGLTLSYSKKSKNTTGRL